MIKPEQRMREAAEEAAGRAPVHDVGKSRPAREQQHSEKCYRQCTSDVVMLLVSHAITMEETMARTTSGRLVLRLAVLALALGSVAATTSAPALAQNQHMDIIHHPNYDRSVFMPFVPGIKIKSGKILWLAGTTALPVYHDHPHKREQILQHMPNDLEAQTRAAMDGIKLTLDAANASFKDVVHYFVFRARPRMGDIGKASGIINSYFAPFNHKPTSTNVAVLELGEPEQLIEIQMFAVVD